VLDTSSTIVVYILLETREIQDIYMYNEDILLMTFTKLQATRISEQK